MNDEIIINIRALSEAQRNMIERILDSQLDCYEDETNAEALEVIRNFKED